MQVTVTKGRTGGFAESVEVDESTTVGQLFTQTMGQNAAPGHYAITLNDRPCSADTALTQGDVVSFSGGSFGAGNCSR